MWHMTILALNSMHIYRYTTDVHNRNQNTYKMICVVNTGYTFGIEITIYYFDNISLWIKWHAHYNQIRCRGKQLTYIEKTFSEVL